MIRLGALFLRFARKELTPSSLAMDQQLQRLTFTRRNFMPCRYLHFNSILFKEENAPIDDGGERVDEAEKKEEAVVPPGDAEQESAGGVPFSVDLDPKKMRLTPKERKMGIRHAIKMSAPTDDNRGMVGATSLLSINTAEVDRHLPTAATMCEQFDGVPFYKLPVVHIKATPNNTIMHTFNVVNKTAIIYTSARKEGFKNAKKKTALAGQTTGAAAGQKLLRRGVTTVRVVVKGLGPGRMSSVKGLASAGVNIVSITDYTHIPELGPRPKKIRRV